MALSCGLGSVAKHYPNPIRVGMQGCTVRPCISSNLSTNAATARAHQGLDNPLPCEGAPPHDATKLHMCMHSIHLQMPHEISSDGLPVSDDMCRWNAATHMYFSCFQTGVLMSSPIASCQKPELLVSPSLLCMVFMVVP